MFSMTDNILVSCIIILHEYLIAHIYVCNMHIDLLTFEFVFLWWYYYGDEDKGKKEATS